MTALYGDPPVQLTDLPGVQQVFGRFGVNIRLDIDRSTVVTIDELQTLVFALDYGSDYVYMWAGNQIALARLQLSPTVYWWASVIAAYRLAMYRQGAVPASLQAEYEATLSLLREVYYGTFRPASMPSRSGAGAAIDPQTMDLRFRLKQMRTEQTLSDGPVQLSPVRREIISQYVYERDM